MTLQRGPNEQKTCARGVDETLLEVHSDIRRAREITRKNVAELGAVEARTAGSITGSARRDEIAMPRTKRSACELVSNLALVRAANRERERGVCHTFSLAMRDTRKGARGT